MRITSRSFGVSQSRSVKLQRQSRWSESDLMHQPQKATQMIEIMEHGWISVTKCSTQVHHTQHNRGLKCQTNLSRIVGGSTRKFRRIKQIITLRGCRVAESFHHKLFSVAASLDPPAQAAAERSHQSIDGASSKSKPVSKRVLACSATSERAHR